LKTKTRKEKQLKFYEVSSLPTLLHGSESWTIKSRDINNIIKARDINNIQSVKTTYIRMVICCTKVNHINSYHMGIGVLNPCTTELLARQEHQGLTVYLACCYDAWPSLRYQERTGNAISTK
jgi:hypothetical protein